MPLFKEEGSAGRRARTGDPPGTRGRALLEVEAPISHQEDTVEVQRAPTQTDGLFLRERVTGGIPPSLAEHLELALPFRRALAQEVECADFRIDLNR